VKIEKEKEGIFLSFKTKLTKGILGLSILYSVLQVGSFFDATEAHALGGGQHFKAKPDYGNRLRYDPNASPVTISFTKYAPNQYAFYGNGNNPPNVMHEDYYTNRFLWYSIVPRVDADNWDSYMARMKENLQKELGTKYWQIDHYADTSMQEDYRYNLKTGQDSPWDNDGLRDGYNSGTKAVTYGTFKGKYYEWRFLGYSADGEPINNPYFPDDYPASDNSDNYWRTKNWTKQSWFDGYSNFYETDYDKKDMRDKKVAWFNKYLKPEHPGLFKGSKDANYWVDYLSLRNDPDKSTGILEGWHHSGGRDYYMTFVMASPKRPNLRLTNFTIKEKGTNNVVGSKSRNSTDEFNYGENSGNKDKYINQSRTYVLEGTVKNMKINGMSAHDTNFTPVHLELAVAYDDNVDKTAKFDEIYKGSQGCKPTSSTNSIRYNTSQNFSCEFTIPNNFSNEIELGLRIANGFDDAGDNTFNDDDESYMKFERSPNDMAIKNTIDFIDEYGMEVDDVIPEMTYDARFYVTRPEGDTPVGAVGNAKNPFTTLDVTATDKGKISVSRKVVASEVLYKGKTISITVNDLIQPQTNIIEACASIDNTHVNNGQNILNGNDGKVCRTIQSDINISVKDFDAQPDTLTLPTGRTLSYENVNLDFTITNFNVQGYSKDIPYIVYKGSTPIKTGTLYDVPANSPKSETIALYNVPLTKGSHQFSIEVNPSPRKYYESVQGVSNPYADNVGSDTIAVVPPPVNTIKCAVENTKNTWTTKYSIYEWWGHESSYWVNGHWNYDSRGRKTSWTSGYRVYYCLTDRTKSSTQTINHYEEYKVSHVFFRSKITDDNNGGWIDLKGGAEGKVKAGYGFEMKVEAKFTTNINTAPKPWQSGCSGMAVSPITGSVVNAPNQIAVTMPYKDAYGNAIKYTLTGSTSGNWYDETQTYEMPLHNAFGLEQTREVFVNETAKDGKYQIKIETDGNFQGSYDKPYKKALCDIEYANITIIGSDKDDLKTHITQ
jgi:fructose-specific phosphotransferase system component IIB